jgi:hypothetical protein
MLHTFCFGSVEHALQARRKQIPALKARNNKARGETPGLEGSGTSPARAAQLLHRPYRAYFARIVPRACALGSVALRLGAPDYAQSKKYAALVVSVVECRILFAGESKPLECASLLAPL